MNCGTVVLDEQFQFTNGKIGKKLLIVLCEFGTDHLVLTTTSQPEDFHRATTRNEIPGCQIADIPPTYFIPKHKYWFNEKTWVELHEVNEYPSYTHEAKRKDGTVIEHKDVLPISLLKEILDCLFQSEFVEGYYLDHLKTVRGKL